MNGGVESMTQHLVPLQWSVEIEEKMMWRKEELNEFNIVAAEGHTTHLDLSKLARVQHAPTSVSGSAGR